MMRASYVFGCVLLVTAQAAAQDRGEEEVAIGRRSEQYATAVRKKDATALNQLLADGYTQNAFLSQMPEDKKGAISYFTDSRRNFALFKTAEVRIRVDGDTAIETGKIYAEMTAFGSSDT